MNNASEKTTRQLSTDVKNVNDSKNKVPKIVDVKKKESVKNPDVESANQVLSSISPTSDTSPQMSRIERSLFVADLQKKLSKIQEPVPSERSNQYHSDKNPNKDSLKTTSVDEKLQSSGTLEYVEMISAPVFEIRKHIEDVQISNSGKNNQQNVDETISTYSTRFSCNENEDNKMILENTHSTGRNSSQVVTDLQKKKLKPIPPKRSHQINASTKNSNEESIKIKTDKELLSTVNLEYVEMRFPLYKNSKPSETVQISDSAQNNETNVAKTNSPRLSCNEDEDNEIMVENVRYSTHIYEDITMLNIEKVDTPVALIKPLKIKTQTDTSCTESTSNVNMATLRPKSPKPIIAKNEKEESFWDKIGTLGRKKRIKEVQEVQEEGKYAIDSPGFAVVPTISPEDYDLEENEERSVIMPKAFEDPKLQELIQVLIDWINDELASQRIIVQDLTEDLYDGQVLQKLFEMLTGNKLDVPEVTQSEEGQKQKLSVVLSHFNRVLGLPHNHNKWNVEVIHSKSIVPILHLLVALARHFRPPVRLPENVSVSVTVVRKTQGQLTHMVVRELITSEYSDVGMRCERDAFDTLFDHAPDKLQVVKKSMVTFVNKHLNKLNLEVTEIESQFHDGVYLIMLMGLLEGFFVPLYSFFPTPKDHDQKVHNVSFAFELMEEVGLARPKARPEDVVNLDLKSTLRVLYNLFNKYKSLL